jgi:hypothetical protein
LHPVRRTRFVSFTYKLFSCLVLAGTMFLFPVVHCQNQPDSNASHTGPDSTINPSGNQQSTRNKAAARSLRQELPDTTVNFISHPEHSPRKAVMYSLIFPGLGQIYNKKYWKIPFIYGGTGAFLYYVSYNQLKYKKFRNALFDQQQTQNPVVIDGFLYDYENLDNGRDYYRRYRDLSIAGLAAMYLLNVIDAMVDAYFVNYDITDDLSFKLEPAVIQNTGLVGETASLGFRINIGF